MPTWAKLHTDFPTLKKAHTNSPPWTKQHTQVCQPKQNNKPRFVYLDKKTIEP